MRKILMMGAGLAMAGCGTPAALTGQGGATSVAYDGLAPAAQCQVWRAFNGVEICRGQAVVIQAADAAEVPALLHDRSPQVVGEEAHDAVLDGAS